MVITQLFVWVSDVFYSCFSFPLSCSNKKVVYSLNWSKEDMSAAASREVPMTKQVIDSLVTIGETKIYLPSQGGLLLPLPS